MNHVALIGHLTRDIEIKRLASGQQVAMTGIACNERWTGQDGQTAERVMFIDLEAWGKTAEILENYTGKGTHCGVEGRLRMDKWQTNDGSWRSKIYLVVDRVHLLDKREAAPAGTRELDRSQSQLLDDDPPF